jgi:hypothetical protein
MFRCTQHDISIKRTSNRPRLNLNGSEDDLKQSE